MQTSLDVLTPERKAKIPVKSITLPVEHGAWGFLLEPLAAGLIIAPGIGALFIAILSVGAFLIRQPLKFLVGDWRQKRSLPRTVVARRFVLIFGSIALTGLLGSLLFAPLHSLAPFVLVAPVVVYLIIQDAARQTREIVPELLAAVALASTITVLALAAGFAYLFAFSLWAIILARLIPSVLYVRSRLRLEKGKAFSRSAPIAAHAVALISVASLCYFDVASILTALMAALLTVRAVFGLSHYRETLKARVIGIWEVIYGVSYASSIAIGYYLDV